MLDRIALLLESRPFDWCINCALASIPKANMTKKLFAKNFISWARLCPEVLQNNMVYELSDAEPIVVRIIFKEKIFEEWDDPVIEKVKYKAGWYKFLTYPLKEHCLVQGGLGLETKSFRYRFEKNDLVVTALIK